MKVIQAGFGNWGTSWHKDVISPFKGVTTTAWVDADPQALERISRVEGVDPQRCFGSIADALKSVSADALIVTAGLGGHVPLCREGLKNGLHVLVEKPFAPKIAQARKLAELADAQKRILMVSQNYRFQPEVRAVEKLLAGGTLGPVYSVSIDFRRNAGIGRKPEDHHAGIDHPLWIDMAIHHYDLLRCILRNNPESVVADSINPEWSAYREAPAGNFLARYADGTRVSYRGSWISAGTQTPWAGKWLMECEKGTIRWSSRGDSGEDTVVVAAKGKKERTITLPKLRYTDRSGALAAFVKAAKSGEEPETSARDNIGTLRFMDAVVRSADSGRTVNLAGR